MNYFTPRTTGWVRKKFRLYPGEETKTARGGAWKATLKLVNGKFIDVRGAACSIPRCYCDAVLIRGPYKKAEGS